MGIEKKWVRRCFWQRNKGEGKEKGNSSTSLEIKRGHIKLHSHPQKEKKEIAKATSENERGLYEGGDILRIASGGN